jgi:hypothetical protein
VKSSTVMLFYVYLLRETFRDILISIIVLRFCISVGVKRKLVKVRVTQRFITGSQLHHVILISRNQMQPLSRYILPYFSLRTIQGSDPKIRPVFIDKLLKTVEEASERRTEAEDDDKMSKVRFM